MTDISPGDEVTVTITGTATYPGNWYGRVVTPGGMIVRLMEEDEPDVKVTVLRPDRPTRREVLERHRYIGNRIVAGCTCGEELRGSHAHAKHLDAVLKKWEES